jgi:hypothetical protein
MEDHGAEIYKAAQISLQAAAKRIQAGRIDVKTPAKRGASLVKTKIYKMWSHIVHGAMNPKSKDYIPGLSLHPPLARFHHVLPGRRGAPTSRYGLDTARSSARLLPRQLCLAEQNRRSKGECRLHEDARHSGRQERCWVPGECRSSAAVTDLWPGDAPATSDPA